MLDATLKTITIDELEIGMYVKDIIWKNSQYKVKTQGVIKSSKTIEQLKKQGVNNIVIEYTPVKERVESSANEDRYQNSGAPKAVNKTVQNHTNSTKSNPPSSNSIEQEFERSSELYDQATEHVKEMFFNAKIGERLSPEAVNELAGEITESVIRNEFAMTMLTRIRHHSTYQWEHSINCGVLLCGFSLYLGLKKETVKQITLGALLHDVGVAKVPKAIIDKPSKLTDNEMSVVKKHVAWGLDICKRDGFVDPFIIDMLVNHHERLNGTGYPRGIKDKKISKLSRMTAIVDVYDAMTGDRSYKKGVEPIKALRYLMSNNELFDQELVQKFIKYLGVHPVGSLVNLNNDKIAVVLEGNRKEPLKPLVKVFYSIKLKHYITPKTIDLRENTAIISGSIKPEEHDINMTKLLKDILN